MPAILHGFAFVSAEGSDNIDATMNALAVLSSVHTNSQMDLVGPIRRRSLWFTIHRWSRTLFIGAGGGLQFIGVADGSQFTGEASDSIQQITAAAKRWSAPSAVLHKCRDLQFGCKV